MDAKTVLYCLLGNPVEHSMSPLVHNAAYKAAGLNAAYMAFRVEDVEAAVKGIRGLGIRGASVTIPHKVSIIEHLDELDELAENIGSVNTVVSDAGKLKGYNTDGPGALKALADAGVEVSGRKVVLMGSGGAARAIAFTVAMEGGAAKLDILGIDEREMLALAKEVDKKTSTRVNANKIKPDILEAALRDADVLINATPIGMHPNVDDSPVPAELLRDDLAVFDIVYNPLKTRLITDAEKSGAKVVLGAEMFINQAVLQFELFTGKDAPYELMRDLLMKKLSGAKTNIVLIGYRGSGKSIVAAILAQKLNMSVFNMDAEIVRRAGKPVPEIVEDIGWDGFRNMETEVAIHAGKMENIIIDAGGGAILKDENVDALKKNGKTYWLTAGIETLASRIKDDTNRPSLSGGKSFVDEIAEVLKEREPKYRAAADHEIDTGHKSPEDVAGEIFEIFSKE